MEWSRLVCRPPGSRCQLSTHTATLSLYFGCRSASKDQHYHSEWEEYTSKQLLNYRVACSRDGPEGVKRTYVQDLMREDAQRIWELVGERGAWVLISG